jgi:hypothetical protein
MPARTAVGLLTFLKVTIAPGRPHQVTASDRVSHESRGTHAPCICANGFPDVLNSPPAQVQAIYKDALLALSKDVDRSR